MQTMNKFLTAIILLGTFSFFSAQEKRTISLEEAVKLGIQNSKYLKVDQAQIEESTANLLAAKNRQLPELTVSGSYLYLPLEPNVNLKIPGLAGGGPKVSNVLYGSANVSVPIYSGGRIKYGIKSAEYLVEASKLNSENDKNAIAYNISQAYNNLFKANEVVKLLKENLTSSQKRDQSFIKLENNGVIARNDRLKAQLQTSNIELQLMEAENNYSIANINMDLLLGFPDNTEIEVDSNYIGEDDLTKPDDYYLNLARESRNDLKALDYQRRAAELGSKSAKAENLPSLAFTGGYVAADIPKLLTITNAVNVGVGIQYNLSNIWKKNSSYVQAKAKEQELAANNDLLNDNITLEVRRDYQNDLFAHKKIDVYQRALEQAEENYRITLNKYNAGLETITNLLDADTAKITANVNVVTSKADAALAHKKLLQTTGTINNN
ncbi:MAG: TolC family protein [Chryseobacterium sp.]|nr:MAG: TolC family protein [Chryseobacterium sp.]